MAIAFCFIFAFSLVGLGGDRLATAATPPTLLNVQVSVQTQSKLTDYYVVSAYNSTGALVTTSQSQYPAGSFQLPAGTYILTATATNQSSYYQAYPVYSNGGTASGAGGSAQPSSAPSVCCIYRQPVVEYGYSVQKVTDATTLTIQTKNINDTSYSAKTIKATFPNGTAAKNAYVYASVLGGWYWGYGPKQISMYDTTDSGGSATVVTPDVPVLVSAWANLPIALPTNFTTVQRTIAGEVVNVTVYWQPTYVSFAGWSLLSPPQQSASLTLHYQQPMYYVYPARGEASVPATSGGSASTLAQGGVAYPDFGPGGIIQPSSVATQAIYTTTGGSGITTTTTSTSNPTYDSALLLDLGLGFAAALVVVLAIFVAARPRRRRQVASV